MGKTLRFREGDFVETKEGLIFDVKGLVHPPDKVIAFVRYVPNPKGNRERGGVKYKKVYELSERYDFLKKNYPQYLVYDDVLGEYLSEVPLKDIVHHYKPQQKTNQLLYNSSLDVVERQTLEFINLLNGLSRVSLEDIGVSGSVLVGLHSKKSDIDLIVYGRDNGLALRETLKKLLHEEEVVKAYGLDVLRVRYEIRQRDTPVSFDDYIFHESRKTFQGFFKGRGFFIRYVKGWNEVGEKYGDIVYKKAGYAKIKGRIADDSEALFTPCTYSLADVEVMMGKAVAPITEVSSFRGRFCEQALRGERVVAQGKLERVSKKGQTHYRLLLGNDPRDYMVTLHGRKGVE